MFTTAELQTLLEIVKDVGNRELTDKIKNELRCRAFRGNVYVDLPRPECIGEDDDSWLNMFVAPSMAEAVKWIQEKVGPCDEHGNICLTTLGDEDDDEAAESPIPDPVAA